MQKSKVDGRSVRQVSACVQRGDGSERLGSAEWNLASPPLRPSSMEWLLNLWGIPPFWEVIKLWLRHPGRSFQAESRCRLTRHCWTLLIRLWERLSNWVHVGYFAASAFFQKLEFHTTLASSSRCVCVCVCMGGVGILPLSLKWPG